MTSAENPRSPAGAARTFDVETIRAQFPILAREVNGTALHYLDNAATTQVPQTVLDAIVDHETRSRANVLRGVHALAEAATKAYESARGDVEEAGRRMRGLLHHGFNRESPGVHVLE